MTLSQSYCLYDITWTLTVKTLQSLEMLNVSMVAVGARVQWFNWFSGSEEGVAAQERQRLRGKQWIAR